MLITLPVLLYILYSRDFTQPYHQNLCSIIDCSFLAINSIKLVIAVLLLLCFTLYVFEIKMLITTFTLSAISILIFSYEEAIGFKGENGLISLSFFAQFFAYLFFQLKLNNNLSFNRVQFPVQVVAAGYVLSGISKLYNSGVDWFTSDAQNFSVILLRQMHSNYATTGNIEDYFKGWQMAGWVINNILLIKILLALSLMLELFTFIVLKNKKIAFYYALMLICMHIGIYFAMDIILPTIIAPMVIFFINPLFLFYKKFKNIQLLFFG